MAKRMIMTGWGLPEYAPAAALLLRCAFKCSAEVIGSSQQYLPTALKHCAETCSEVYVLGVGLTKDPKAIAVELRALKEAGVKVWWISAREMPSEVAIEFTMKDGGSVFDKVVIAEGDLFDAVQKAFPRQVAQKDVESFRRFAFGRTKGDSEEGRYRHLFTAADWKHKNDREMGYYPRAIFGLANGVRYDALESDLHKIVDYYNKWGKRELIGVSPHMLEVRQMAEKAAECDDPVVRVLITGPSGTGKETVAQLIHRKSKSRANGAFLTFNCACTTASLFESKLFGSVKGAFTDARDSRGLLEAAANGTLFLDEVAELDLEMQGQLLRVLQDGDFLKVGESVPRRIQNVRIIAATNKDIVRLVNEGRFREDLYYRLNQVQLMIPPLRERGEDIVLLFRLFAMQMAEKYKMDRVVLDDDAKQLLMRYKWPGNVRQLKNITEQISVLSPERRITAEVLSRFIPQDQETTQLAPIHHEGGDHSFENEREILYKILFELRGNVNDMRREMSALKKQLDEVQGAQTVAAEPLTTTQLAPIQPIRPLQPTLEDAVAEEYIEPVKEPENLNLNDLSKQMLEKALERNHGNRKKAAQELGISDRTLYRRLKQYGLDQ